MNFKFSLLFPVIAIFHISCNNAKDETITQNIELKNNETPLGQQTRIPAVDTGNIIKSLQGEWKETAYPYRHAHFKNTTVKFTEEGVIEPPAFRAFRILKDCPFAVNNIKNATSTDVFLVMEHSSRCEIIKVSGDTLSLSGYNTSNKSDYRILYGKVQ